MKTGDVVEILLMAVTYYLFSYEFFEFSAKIEDRKITNKIHFISFLLVYIWFIVASLLELSLVINWFVFLVILGLEVHFVFSLDYLVAYALSMFCTITGLAVNIFFRSLLSITLNIPLNIFDGSMSSVRKYPIFLGFIFMALLLLCLRYLKFSTKLKRMLQNKKSLIFYAWTEIYIYLFLIIQLLLYTQSDNSLDIKIWGIKSSVFSIIILIITIIYALRVASLNYYMDKKHEMHKRLIQEKENINKLWELAYTDMLTGCGNRQLLDKRLAEYVEYGGNISIAFIDVNGLKKVNDQFGHLEGDRYLMIVTNILLESIKNYNLDLFRYGGDEFIMMSNSLNIEVIDNILKDINHFLNIDEQTIYKKSISYGVVCGESSDYAKLINMADEKMYHFKMQYYENIVRY